MKVTVNVRKHFYAFLLVCLAASPMTALAETASVDVVVPVESPRLSDVLKSPLTEDLLLYAQSMPYGLVQNPNFYHVMANRGFLAPAEIQKLSSASQQARFSLIKDLQFTNQMGLKSIVTTAFKPKTQAGKLKLEELFAADNTNWELTKKRQAFVKMLVDSPETLAKLQSSLDVIRDTENTWLSKFTPEHPMMQQSMKMMKMMFFGYAQLLILYPLLSPELAGGMSTSDACIRAAKGEALLGMALVLYYAHKEFANYEGLGNAINILIRLLMGVGPVVAGGLALAVPFKKGPLYSYVKPATADLSKRSRILLSAYVLLNAWSLNSSFKQGYADSVKEFAEASGIVQFITSSKDVRETILSNPILATVYEDAFGDMSSSWNELERRAVDHKNSTGPSWLSTSNVNINNMFDLMKKTNADIARTIQFYGEMDAYAAVAQFVVDHQTTQNNVGDPIRVCYSEFIEDSEESIVDAQLVWHPLISEDRVQANTIKLGGSVKTPRNAVVTGPNAAGKSVSLKALLVNVIMAQTFGVACAESFRFTPFTKIIGRLNAPDDTANDSSKFFLEAKDVVNMLTQLKSLKPNEHAFVVTDELFSGTEVGPAIALSKRLCKRIGEKMKNVIYILATHYKDLTGLKELTDNAFENYKVSVTKNADGTLSYPFKLTHGVGNTNVAFDIFLHQMEQQGLGDEELKAMIMEARADQEASEAEVASAAA